MFKNYTLASEGVKLNSSYKGRRHHKTDHLKLHMKIPLYFKGFFVKRVTGIRTFGFQGGL